MKAIKDYYRIMELTREATVADIKKAYRRLAKKYHPDPNPLDPESTRKFQELNEANQVLSHPLEREKYHIKLDRQQKEIDAKKAAMEKERAEKQRQEMERLRQEEIKRQQQQKEAAAKRKIEADKLFHSKPETKKTINYIRVDGYDVFWTFYAFHWEVFSPKEITLKVNGLFRPKFIQPGFRDGQRFLYKEGGVRGRNGGRNGDLIAICKILPDPFYKRYGKDLLINFELDRNHAYTGGRFLITLPKGEFPVLLKGPLRNGDRRKVIGLGFPVYKEPGRYGDLIITITVV